MTARIVFSFLISATAGLAADEGAVTQAACQPGGFQVIQFAGGDARPKADASFSVLFDAAHYRENGFDAALRSAMSAWSVVSGSKWSYLFAAYDGDPAFRDGQMKVTHGGFSFPPGVLAATLGSASVSTGQIVDADIFFNPAFKFSTNPSAENREFDFESVALHEMGHGLGLDHNDECFATPTVMRSAIKAGARMRALLSPEMEGVRYLYPGTTRSGSLAASPSSLSFAVARGGPAPPVQTVTLSLPATTSWSAFSSTDKGDNWLAITPKSGLGPVSVTVTAAPALLEPGSYTGRVTIAAGGLSATLSVVLSISPVQANPSAFSFSALAGVAPPGPQTLNLSGPAGLTWSATAATVTGGGWLRLSSAGGVLPASPAVSVSLAGLEAGLYSGRIIVAAEGAAFEIPVQLSITVPPRLIVEPSQLSLAGTAGSTTPVCASIAIRSAGIATLEWSAGSSAPWLSISPGSGRSNSTATLCATAAALALGNYSARASFSALVPNSPQTVGVTFSVAPRVLVSDGGVLSAASFARNQPIVAGELLSIFGLNLASATASAAGFPLPTELGGCRVLIGGTPARLIYVSPGQVNLVAPSRLAELAGSTATVTVFNGGTSAPPVSIAVGRQAPGVFTLANGGGAGAVTHADASLVTREAPLAPGEAISVYLTGIGPLDLSVPEGEAAPANPLARASSAVRLLIDGAEATVLFAGAAPGFAGLHVVVAAVPESIARRFPEMEVQVGGIASNRFTAGGPTLLDVTPVVAQAGSDATVTIRGFNLPQSSGLLVAGAVLPALSEGPDRQVLRVTIPARLLASPGALSLRVIDVEAPAEPASNPLPLMIEMGGV